MSKTFIILEPDPVICLDLGGLLNSAWPDGTLIFASTFEGVGTALLGADVDTTAILRGSAVMAAPDRDAALRTVEAAGGEGARIVVIGTPIEVGIPTHVVEVPFTSDTVLQSMLPPVSDAD